MHTEEDRRGDMDAEEKIKSILRSEQAGKHRWLAPVGLAVIAINLAFVMINFGTVVGPIADTVGKMLTAVFGVAIVAYQNRLRNGLLAAAGNPIFITVCTILLLMQGFLTFGTVRVPVTAPFASSLFVDRTVQPLPTDGKGTIRVKGLKRHEVILSESIQQYVFEDTLMLDPVTAMRAWLTGFAGDSRKPNGIALKTRRAVSINTDERAGGAIIDGDIPPLTLAWYQRSYHVDKKGRIHFPLPHGVSQVQIKLPEGKYSVSLLRSRCKAAIARDSLNVRHGTPPFDLALPCDSTES